jgi:flagellar biosynthetic protein FliR
MPLELLGPYLNLPLLALVTARLSGLVLFQPVLSAMLIPTQVRALLVIGLAMLVTPLIALPAGVPDTLLGLILALAGELLLGIVLGAAVRLVFHALELGGLIIAQESGLAFAQIADPTTDAQHDILSVLYVQIGMIVYLVIGGHRALVGAVLDSFQVIPPLSAPLDVSGSMGLLMDALAASCSLAVRIAAPALLALFLVNVALAFISRTVPQLNVIALSFSMKGMLVFLLIAVSLPTAVEGLITTLEEVVGWCQSDLLSPAGGVPAG